MTTETDYRYRYFFTYTARWENSMTIGNHSMALSCPVRDTEVVQYVQDAIQRANPQLIDVVVTGWQRFED